MADELHRSGIDARDVWNRAVGGILHRHSMQPGEKATKTGLELLTSGVPFGLSRQMSQRVALDDMDQGPRFAGRRNQVEPAPCGQMATLA